ncbi:MAG: selenide, water dikinase SelD [Gemmatimonadota bacterium]|jgi:selenide,water dikinase
MTELTQVLRHLLPVDDPRALVDASTGDDAAVYRLAPDRALVVTTDFFTPIVDEPRDFGRIAAANALSDVYAMGGRPLFALNLVGFPRKHLGDGLLEEMVRGTGETCREAGIPILGGHSIDDPEPKLGLVVVGEVHPDRMVRTSGARPGDVLVLTKPLGTGVIATAIKAGAASTAARDRAVETMTTLNRGAAEAMVEVGVRAATDVTGYGLLGHLRNLLRASDARAEVRAADVPLLEGAVELAAAGHVPGGTTRNLADLMEDVLFDASVSDAVRTLLADAQTSGGLLMATPPERVGRLLEALAGRAPVAAVVGEVVAGRSGSIAVV